MRRPLRLLEVVAALVGLALTVTSAPVRADDTVVVVWSPDDVARWPTTRERIVAELEAAGYSAVVVDAPSGGSLDTADALAEAAQDRGASAALRIVATSDGTGVRIWVDDQRSGTTLMRRVDSRAIAEDPAAELALRAMALVHAGLLARAPAPPSRLRLGIGLSLGGGVAVDGPSPLLAVGIGAWLEWNRWLRLGVRARGTPIAGTLDRGVNHADVWIAVVAGTADFVLAPTWPVRPVVGAEVGALLSWGRGVNPGGERRASSGAMALSASLALEVPLGDVFTIGAVGLVTFAIPAISIQFYGAEAGALGVIPSGLLTLGGELPL